MNKPLITPIWGIMIFVFIFWSLFLTYKYLHFGFCDWDLAFFNQSFWNLLRGRQFSSIFGYNFFGDHTSFLVFLLLPLYAIFQSPLTLLYIKVGAFVLSLYWFYKCIHEDLGEGSALFLVILFALFPPNIFALLYEFNMECFAPLFIFIMFYAHRKENLGLFWTAAILMCLTKENLILIVIGFGVYSLFLRRRIAFSWAPILFGTAILFLSMSLVKYFKGGEGISAWLRYQHLFVTPFSFFEYLFSSQNLKFVLDLFGVFLIPAFFFPSALLIGAPLFLQHMLSVHYTEHTIFYFYGFALTPFIFISSARFFHLLRSRFSKLIYTAVLVFFGFLSVGEISTYERHIRYKTTFMDDRSIADRYDFMQRIPSDAKIIASFDIQTMLSSRQFIYPFYKVYSDRFQDPVQLQKNEFAMGKAFTCPDDVAYAVIDMKDPWATQSRTENERISRFLSRGWDLVDRKGSLMLYHREIKK